MYHMPNNHTMPNKFCTQLSAAPMQQDQSPLDCVVLWIPEKAMRAHSLTTQSWTKPSKEHGATLRTAFTTCAHCAPCKVLASR
jgi:hypothetical protein